MVGGFVEDEYGKAARDRVGPDLDEDAVGSSSLEESKSTRSKGSVRSIARASCPSLTTEAPETLSLQEAKEGHPPPGIAGYHQYPSRLPLLIVALAVGCPPVTADRNQGRPR